MIAKGTTHANGAKLGAYMVTGKDGERAQLHELRGFAEADIVDAFRSEHVIAQGTRCDRPFFHLQVRNPEGEHLTRAQWMTVASKIESKLGLIDQPRAIAFHAKDGHEHMHVAWSRIDHDTLKAKPLPFFKLRLNEVSRELERELGLRQVRSSRGVDETRSAKRAERDQAVRLGIDVEAVRDSIRQAWTHSDNGAAFQAALLASGMTLCQGDRRDFVVLDGEGGIHALGKRLLDSSAADVRGRCKDLNREGLPTVADARETLARKAPQLELKDIDQDEARQRGHGATTSDNLGMVAQNAEANRRHLELNPFLKPPPETAASRLERYMQDAAFRKEERQRYEAEQQQRGPDLTRPTGIDRDL